MVEVFEVICDPNMNTKYAGKNLLLCRQLDLDGGNIPNTEFFLNEDGDVLNSNDHGKDFSTEGYLSYYHAEVLDINSSCVELKGMPYKCMPLPDRSSDWTVLQHPEGKIWAIKQEGSAVVVLFRNKHTSGRWIHAELTKKFTPAQCMKKKLDSGYRDIYQSTKTWKSPARSFS